MTRVTAPQRPRRMETLKALGMATVTPAMVGGP